MAASPDGLRSLVASLVQEMKARGNQSGLVTQWKEKVAKWAESNPKSLDAQAVSAMLPLWQVRPFYTADELAPILPALFMVAGLRETPGPKIGPATTKNMLLKSGLPLLANGALFRNPFTGASDQYFIVERIHHWAKRPMQQEEFDLWMVRFSRSMRQ